METSKQKVEETNMDTKFAIALKAIETAQHQVKSGQDVNLSHLLDEVRKSVVHTNHN